MPTKTTIEEKFWLKVDQLGGDDGCWFWLGELTNGYGRLYQGEHASPRRIYAHRFAYELLVGPIPEGLTIDHLCRNRSCVNPAHLEPVTNAENLSRGESPSARNAQKTHCKRGHEFTEENTYVNPNTGGRWCRTCQRNWWRQWAGSPEIRAAALSENVQSATEESDGD